MYASAWICTKVAAVPGSGRRDIRKGMSSLEPLSIGDAMER